LAFLIAACAAFDLRFARMENETLEEAEIDSAIRDRAHGNKS